MQNSLLRTTYVFWLIFGLALAGVFFVFITFQKPKIDETAVARDAKIVLESRIVAGKEAKWVLEIKKSEVAQGRRLAELPKTARNIEIKNTKSEQTKNLENSPEELSRIASAGLLEGLKNLIFGASRLLDTRVVQTNEALYFDITKENFLRSGLAAFLFSKKQKPDNWAEMGESITISFTTPAPKIKEKTLKNSKQVVISGPDDPQLEYNDVLAYTAIPEIYSIEQEEKIKLKWQNENNKEIPFEAFDSNNNGKIDFITWNVPHLSEQTFEIIYISKAFELDKNKNIIADIYDLVKEKDNEWAGVPVDNYVRVTFEKILTNQNDITIYARSSPSLRGGSQADEAIPASEIAASPSGAPRNDDTGATIEVYAADSGQLVAIFPAIDREGTYKILLTELQKPTDTFDLKVVCDECLIYGIKQDEGGVDIDYIVDPTFTLLRSFAGGASDGSYPYGSLILSGSTLYGMTEIGGASDLGTIFSISTDGTGFSVLRSFAGGASDGRYPYGSLILSGSTLYGVTYYGGASDYGTVFSINTDGTGFSILRSFAGGASDGKNPYGSLMLSGSTLYGMTYTGGASDLGTIFSIGTDGTGFSILRSFAGGASDGQGPQGSLILSGSTLYGMTLSGGASDYGTVFSINTNGTGFSILRSFAGGASDGRSPYGSLILSGSTLYGMTYTGGASIRGTIFSINTDGTGFSILRSFAGGASDGRNPFGSLILSGSTLYGMTWLGGVSNYGTVFSIGTDGTGFTLLRGFAGGASDGRSPYGSLMLSGSTLYGMTYYGGSSNKGTIFSLITTNTAPSITAGPSDGGSSASAPTTAGNGVNFSATATDSESNNYYLAICKTDAITANDGAAPTCGGGNWCVSTSTASASQATCSYTTQASDAGSQAWFAFVCDYNTDSECSVSSQSTGNNGSPFVVEETGNIAPSITAGPSDGGSSASVPTTIGNNVTFTSTASDSESDNYYMAVCKTDAITPNNNAAPTCGGGNWCVSTSTASASQATCAYTTLEADAGNKAWYVFVCDHNASSACSGSSQGAGDNGSPFVVGAGGSGAGIRFNSGIKINGGIKGP